MQNPETWDTFTDSRNQNPLNNDTYVTIDNNAGYTSLMAVLQAVRHTLCAALHGWALTLALPSLLQQVCLHTCAGAHELGFG